MTSTTRVSQSRANYLAQQEAAREAQRRAIEEALKKAQEAARKAQAELSAARTSEGKEKAREARDEAKQKARQLQQELDHVKNPENKLQKTDIQEVKLDLNADGKKESVFVDKTRYDKITPEALMEDDSGIVAIDGNADGIDDKAKFAAGGKDGHLSNAASELGVTFKEGSKVERDVTYKGWSSREIEGPPEFVNDFDYMKKYEEAYPGGKWVLVSHENQGSFARYYPPKDKAPEGMPFQETSIIRPENYGNKSSDDLATLSTDLQVEDAKIPEGKYGKEAARLASQVLAPDATTEQRQQAYDKANTMIEEMGGVRPANEVRQALHTAFEDMDLPVNDVEQTGEAMDTVDALLGEDATLDDRRYGYEVARELTAGQCLEPGALEAQLKERFGAIGIPLAGEASEAAAVDGESETEAASPELQSVLDKAAEEAGISAEQAEYIQGAMLKLGSGVELTSDEMSRLDPVAMGKMRKAFEDAALSSNLDVPAWIGREGKEGVSAEETESLRSVLADMSFTVGKLEEMVQTAPADSAQEETADGAVTQAEYEKHMDALSKAWPILARGDHKVSVNELTKALNEGEKWDGKQLSQEGKDAIRFVLSNPELLREMDVTAKGKTDSVLGPQDVERLKAKGGLDPEWLAGLKAPATTELTVEQKNRYLDVIKDNLDVLDAGNGNARDGVFALKDMARVIESTDNAELREALVALVSDKSFFDSVDGADGGDKVDGKFAAKDLEKGRDIASADEVGKVVKDKSWDELSNNDERFLWSLNVLAKDGSLTEIVGNDHIFSRDDLMNYSGSNAEVRRAAEFLATHEEYLQKVDGADGRGLVDGKMAHTDVKEAFKVASGELLKVAERLANGEETQPV